MANETVQRLLARVREWREARGLSQEAFAERAGLSYKHYQRIEAGRKPKIQLPTIEKLAKGCGLELSELFNFDASLAVGEDPPVEKPVRAAKRRRKR